MKQIVHIYTDGACRGNPGPGGWGALLRYDGHEKKIKGAVEHATNNQMELMAAIKALNTLKYPCDVILHTDSIYVKNGITVWLDKWLKNNWRNSNKKPVKNQDLWQELQQAEARHKSIKWVWVKGHSNHPENDLADELANQAIDQLLRKS